MKIGISGTHGTGKSFTLFQLSNEYRLKYPTKSFYLIQEIARECPFPINKEAPIESEIWMISTQIQKELEAEKRYNIVLCDRCLIDYFAYTQYISKKLYKKLFPLLEYHVSSYDKIYFKTLENNPDYLIDDGVRDMDKDFQIKIDKILHSVFHDLDLMENVIKI